MDRGSREPRLGLEMAPPLLSPHCSPSRHHKSITEPLPRARGSCSANNRPNQSTAKGVALETILHTCQRQQTHVRKQMWFSAKRLFSARGTVPSLPCPHSKETEVPWKHLAGFHPHEAGKDSPRQFLLFLVPDIAVGQLHSWPQCHMSTSPKES